MNRPIENFNYSDLKQEIEALRKRIGDMESEQARSRTAGRPVGSRRLSRKPGLTVFLVIVGALLTLGVLVAQSSQPDALFINQSGNVGIGTKTPRATLDVAGTSRFNGGVGINTAPIANQNLVIRPTKNNLPFNVTDPDGKINWLSVMPTGQVRMNGGNVGIGTTDPKATLDVAGTSRFNGGIGINTAPIAKQNLVITPTDGDRPFNVTDAGGAINWLSVMPDGKVLMNGGSVGIGTTTPQARLDVKGEIRGKPWISVEYEWKKGHPAKQMTKADRTVCFLTLISGQFYGPGEVVQITQSGNYWMLGGIARQLVYEQKQDASARRTTHGSALSEAQELAHEIAT